MLPNTRKPRSSPKTAKIKKLLALGTFTPAMIAERVKCDLSHVYRTMKLQGIDPKAAKITAAQADTASTVSAVRSYTWSGPFAPTTTDTVAPMRAQPAPFYGSIPPEAAHAASEIDDYKGGHVESYTYIVIAIAATVAVIALALYLTA